MKPIWLSHVDCSGSENRFTQCLTSSPIGYGDCTGSQELATVRCGKSIQNSKLSSIVCLGFLLKKYAFAIYVVCMASTQSNMVYTCC